MKLTAEEDSVLRYVLNHMTGEERRRFEAGVHENRRQNEILSDVRETMEALGAWSRQFEADPEIPLKRKQVKTRTWIFAAAAAVIVVFLGYFLSISGSDGKIDASKYAWKIKGKSFSGRNSSVRAVEVLEITGIYGSSLTVQPDSLVIIPDRNASEEDMRNIEILSGRLEAHVRSLLDNEGNPVPFNIKALSCDIRVREADSKFRVEVLKRSKDMKNAVKMLSVVVLTGSIMISNRFGSVTLFPGQEVAAAEGSAPVLNSGLPIDKSRFAMHEPAPAPPPRRPSTGKPGGEKDERVFRVPLVDLKNDYLDNDFSSKFLKAERLDEKPDGAKAPEGRLAWFKLTVGDDSHVLCIKYEKDKTSWIYLDLDGDKDFTEEKPAKVVDRGGYMPGITDFAGYIKDVPGRFTINGESISMKMVLAFRPRGGEGKESLWVTSRTYLAGKPEHMAEHVVLAWFPGAAPEFRAAPGMLPVQGVSGGDRIRGVWIGKRCMTPDVKSVKISKGKASATYRFVEDKDPRKVEVYVTKKLESVYLYANTAYENVIYTPEKGVLYLYPGRSFGGMRANFVKTDAKKKRWMLSIRMKDFVAENGSRIGSIEPLEYKVRVDYDKNGNPVLWPNLTDLYGGYAFLKKADEKTEPPLLKIRNSEGGVVFERRLKAGRYGGHEKLVLDHESIKSLKKGKYRIELEIEKTPFKIETVKKTLIIR